MPGGQPLRQPGDERVEPAGFRGAHRALREALGTGEAAHGGPRQPRGLLDGAQRLSGLIKLSHFFVTSQRARPAGGRGPLLGSAAWEGAATARAQPRGQGLGAAVRQQVNYTPGLQVHEDGAVGAPALKGPIIYAQGRRSGSSRQRSGAYQAQKRVGASGHRQIRQQASARFAAESNRHRALRRRQSAGASRVRCEQSRQTLGEGAAGTGHVATAKTTHA